MKNIGIVMRYSIFYDISVFRLKPEIVTFTFNDKDCEYFGWKRGIIFKWLWFWIHFYQAPIKHIRKGGKRWLIETVQKIKPH